MPFINHNEPWILENIKKETDRTRDLLRRLRLLVEQGQIHEPPLKLITELGQHAYLLSHLISQYTIRHDYVDENDNLHHSEYEGVIAFVEHEVQKDPLLLTAPISHGAEPDEHQLYRELGFSEQEYKDLVRLKEAWLQSNLDMKGAFDLFTNEVVTQMMAGRYSIRIEDLVPGVAGLVGIAIDVTFFAPTAAVPPLVSSCATGLAAIAAKFPDVLRKLLERGR